MRKLFRALCLGIAVASLMAARPCHAVEPDEMLANPALEARARALSGELRCLVCQNQSIDNSNAPLARDLRLVVRERLKTGDSDRQILDYIVGRYGEFVLLRPRFGGATLLLWFAPLLVLAGGVWIARGVWLNRPTADDGANLSEDEKLRLAAILAEDEVNNSVDRTGGRSL